MVNPHAIYKDPSTFYIWKRMGELLVLCNKYYILIFKIKNSRYPVHLGQEFI